MLIFLDLCEQVVGCPELEVAAPVMTDIDFNSIYTGRGKVSSSVQKILVQLHNIMAVGN